MQKVDLLVGCHFQGENVQLTYRRRIHAAFFCIFKDRFDPLNKIRTKANYAEGRNNEGYIWNTFSI